MDGWSLSQSGKAVSNLIPCVAMSKEFRTWKIDEIRAVWPLPLFNALLMAALLLHGHASGLSSSRRLGWN
jgi:hypothetical protein